MTRPQYIRADTLDLQDKSSPTAQDHSLQPETPAPLGIGPAAPHQQASLRQVEIQRTEEERRLQNAWNSAGTTLSEDPGSDDEKTVINANSQQQDEQAVRLNGGMTVDGEDADMQDADAEDDLDDDMMDKISSSPSIDDGGYSLPSYPTAWPARRESLTPTSSPLQSIAVSSSPFVSTPIHFPISVAKERRLPDVTPIDTICISKSPLSSPIPISFRFTQQRTPSQLSEHHRGEYHWKWATRNTMDAVSAPNPQLSPKTKQLKLVERRLQLMREDSQASIVSDQDEEQARNMLRPLPKPPVFSGDSLQKKSENRTSSGTPPPKVEYSDEEEGSWTTDSDADSWDPDDENDDASNDISFSDDSRFIDSGWGGECLRETEDIDFEFVYALHTFVATVEGQANATKGDSMVLLDDSNSYWWLVRIVKDSSIGYLPAEHIETPTERLARLNKHRNIDLSATMLGDTAEKPKNPLKKAMRRRNAKTVQFAPPTYVEPSDYDYSSDEDSGELFGGPEPKQIQQQQQQQAPETENAKQDDGVEVQPLKVNGVKDDSTGENGVRVSGDDARKDDKQEAVDDMDRPMDPKVTRNGTLRNTDSFFKDETTETRKITLTPNLLRDDSSTSTTGSRERGASLESLEKNGFADKVKDDKKKKEKKPGMLSGLFKRKDKKSKGMSDSIDSDVEKPLEEADHTSTQSKPPDESAGRSTTEPSAPQRQSSKNKLQKSQRNRDDSPQKTKSILKTDSPMETSIQTGTESEAPTDKNAAQQAPSTMRMVSDEQDTVNNAVSNAPNQAAQAPDQRTAPGTMGSRNPYNNINATQKPHSKPEPVKKAKQRIQLDDFDTDDDSDPFADPNVQAISAPTSQPQAVEPAGRLSESPVHVSAADAQPPTKEAQQSTPKSSTEHPPGLTHDNSSQETSSPISTPTPDDSPIKPIPENSSISTFRSSTTPSPTPVTASSTTQASAKSIPPPNRPAPIPAASQTTSTPSAQLTATSTTNPQPQHYQQPSTTTPTPPTSTTSSTLPPWSDAALRAYLDDGTEIRDFLLLVHDTSGVVPVGKEHPLMKGLWEREREVVGRLGGELDGLLRGVMERGRRR